ncbi:MAG: LuxR C-terminal-related transcriptional regulator [bacterium]|nr:LuxR C-terminal-related transcriptional regulator [bacterium]
MAKRGRGRPPHPDVLTPAEWRVLYEVRTGATNAEVAVRLGIGLATVKFHIRNIRRKLDVSDRDELATWKGKPGQEPPPARRGLLAPLGLLMGFWKPAAATLAAVVVSATAIGAGILAYTIVNDGEWTAEPSVNPAQTSSAGATATPPPNTPQTDSSPMPEATATSEVPSAAPPTPQGEVPTITFWGGVTEAQRNASQARLADVVRFFDEALGIHVPNLSVHVAADERALAAALGRPLNYEEVVHPALYAERSIFVHYAKTLDWMERLYFEAFAAQTAGDRDAGPEWLREGGAMYAAHLFRHWRGEQTLADALALVHWMASYDDTPLEALERQSPTEGELLGSETASTATLAVEWLVERAGVDALVAYYRALPKDQGWEAVFERTFEVSSQAAYEAFAAHRAQVLVERWNISGRVLGPYGALVKTLLFVSAHRTDGSGSEGTTVQTSGEYTLRPPDGTYVLSVSIVCPGATGELGWYQEQSGHTTTRSEATVVTVEGASVRGIVIRLPASPEELVPDCFIDGES